MSNPLRIALPSKGTLYESTLALFKSCGLTVSGSAERSYEAKIPQLGATVLYQRPTEIPLKVEEEIVEVGVTGLDLVAEREQHTKNVVVLIDDLRFGRADVVLAVPQDWIDVTHVHDLVDLSLRWRRQGRPLRIATKFNHLTTKFLEAQGLSHFLLVPSDGATEIAPKLGDADLIADTVTTGNTLRANGLRPIYPAIFSSQACLIASHSARNHPRLAEFVDRLESYLRAGSYSMVMAVATQTLAPASLEVFDTLALNITAQGHHLSLVVTEKQLYPVVKQLRNLQCTNISVVPIKYFFTPTITALES